VSLKAERRMRLFGQSGYVNADFDARKLTAIGRERGIPVPGLDGGRLEQVSWAPQDALAAEHAAFVASIVDGAPVLVDAAAGRRALDVALQVSASMAASRRLAVAAGLIRGGT
jgi:predicted dehydrogenase